MKSLKIALAGPALAIGVLTGLAPVASAATAPAHSAADVQPAWHHGHHAVDPRWDNYDPRGDGHQGNRYAPQWGYWRYDPRGGYWHFAPNIGRSRWDPRWDRRWDHRWDHRWH